MRTPRTQQLIHIVEENPVYRVLQRDRPEALRRAADMFEQARSILVAAYGASHARVVKLDQMLVALYEEWGRPLPRR